MCFVSSLQTWICFTFAAVPGADCCVNMVFDAANPPVVWEWLFGVAGW